MPLKIKDDSVGSLVALHTLTPSDVFQHDGDTYMVLDRPNVNDLVNTFNLTRRYITMLSEDEKVLLLEATLEVRVATRPAADTLNAEELAECRMGRKIQAIKLHRERTRVGLRESKETVEREAARHGIVF